MTAPTYAKGVAALLGRTGPPSTPSVSFESRAHGIDAISRALAGRGRRRTRRRVIAGAVVVLCVAAALVMVLRPAGTSTGEVAVRVAGSPGADIRVFGAAGVRSGSLDRALEPGDRIVTGPNAGAQLRLSTGTRLGLGRGTELSLSGIARTQRFDLREGSVHAQVAPVSRGGRFVIGTPDAEVEVHGTSFRVEVAPSPLACAGSRTQVFVTSGVVSVRYGGASARLTAGMRWPASCAAQKADVAGAPAVLDATPAVRAGLVGPASARAGLVGPASTDPPPSLHGRAHGERLTLRLSRANDSSDLAAQNDTFARALQAARDGDEAGAIARFEALLRRYPRSPLAESAAAEQLHLLRTFDPAHARLAARNYLARFPRGSAADEARRLLSPASP